MMVALQQLGWQRSARSKAPVDALGDPLPWYTYPAIAWLGPRLRDTDAVFEFGCGNSTLWYAARVASVRSVEHSEEWASHVRASLPANASTITVADPGDGTEVAATHPYVAALRDAGTDRYDVIVVDGRVRVSSVEAALDHLSDDGLLVLDNSDRPQYRPAFELADAAGLGRIDFSGPVPGSGRLSTTTMFLRGSARWLRATPALPHLGY